MIRKNRHSIVLLLVINLLVSNIGLSANWMYCYCKGQMQMSLFSLDDSCNKEDNGEKENCCKTADTENEEHLKPCCKKFQQFHKVEKPCTKKGTKYFKADLKFFFTEKNTASQKNNAIDNTLFIATSYHIPYYYLGYYSPNPSIKAMPPPPLPYSYGRSLLYFIQNFRC